MTNGRRPGKGPGIILKAVRDRSGLARAILAGGDSSSQAPEQLDIHALTTRLPPPETPGSPLCAAHSSSEMLQGIEIALKGGQAGSGDCIVMPREGAP